MTTKEEQDWQPVAALLKGRFLVEASAGTGKTYQITNLVVRLVAEHDVRIERVLVVTFTRAATAELRGRVRARIAEVLAVLHPEPKQRTSPGKDEVLIHFAGALGSAEAATWRTRLERAREDFDQAGISTIHSFCQDVLRTHAFASGIDLDRELVQDLRPLLEELVDDWLLRERHAMTPAEVAAYSGDAGMDRKALLKLGAAVIDAPDVPLEPKFSDTTLADLDARREVLRAWWAAGGRVELMEALEQFNTVHPPGTTKHYVVSKGVARHSDFVAVLDSIGPALDSVASLPNSRFTAEEFESKRKNALVKLGVRHMDDLCALVEEATPIARAAFAAWIRTEAPARLEQRRAQGFADLLRLVRDAVVKEPDGVLVRDLRGAYDVALIDEFQDTDATQWAIFETLFGQEGPEGPTHWFYLIGDPKQAIYAFRGADVFVYLQAAKTATHRYTMRVNQRSDGRLVRAANALFRDAPSVLEQKDLLYIPVEASPRNPDARLLGCEGDEAAPLQVRFLDQGARGRDVQTPGAPFVLPKAGRARALAAEVAASDIRALLDGGRIRLAAIGERDPIERPVRAGDIAVLVRTHAEGVIMERVIQRLGLPVVRSGVGSVFHSEEALHLERWLAAVSEPANTPAARALAITPFGRWSATDLAEAFAGKVSGAATGAWALWIEQIHARAHACARRSLAQVLGRELSDAAFLATLAGMADADRRLTNYRQLAEILHAVQSERHLGLRGVLVWLQARRRTKGSDDEVEADGVQLRLETDTAAIRIVTIHASKGLEYPIVFAPFLWSERRVDPAKDVVIRRHEDDGRLTMDARTSIPTSTVKEAQNESSWESLRLLYVAVTRARHRLVVTWPAQWNSRSKGIFDAPLSRVLFGHVGADADAVAVAVADAVEGGQKAKQNKSRADRSRAFLEANLAKFSDRAAILAALDELVKHSHDDTGNTVAVTPCEPPCTTPIVLEDAAVGIDPVAIYPARPLERVWVRTSYSGLTRNRHGVAVRPDAMQEGEDVLGDALSAASVAVAEQELRSGTDENHDEPDEGMVPDALVRAVPQPVSAPLPSQSPVPWSELPGGTEFGTYVHSVLEGLDFQTQKERGGKQRSLFDYVHALGVTQAVGGEQDHRLLAEILPGVLATPLGSAAGGIRLCDLTPANRLDELAFDLPIRGGTEFRQGLHPVLDPAQLRAALGRVREDGNIPASYLALLRESSFTLPELAGFLTGSIDLAYRVGTDDAQRWYVCDYKSNRVAPAWKGGPKVVNTREHYTQPWLRWAMAHHHYYIQYHLYLLALHRYLGTRLPNYDYDRHIGGAVYLFLRGMSADDVGAGVYVDKPPRDVIDALDACFSVPAPLTGMGPGGSR